MKVTKVTVIHEAIIEDHLWRVRQYPSYHANEWVTELERSDASDSSGSALAKPYYFNSKENSDAMCELLIGKLNRGETDDILYG